MMQWNQINKCFISVNKNVYRFIFMENRRFAGHSKWQNIKHIKAGKDSERAQLFLQLKQKMRVAIAEGGSAKPEENTALARLIEQCKKANMPAVALNTFLEKMRSGKERNQSALVELRGPENSIIIVKIETDNFIRSKMEISSKIRKFSNVKIIEGCIKSIFSHVGIITTDKKYDYDKAVEDALNVEATDVEEVKDEKDDYYKFKCDPQSISVVKNKLESLNYSVIAAEEDFIPHLFVELSESGMSTIKSLEEKLLQLTDVSNIYTNISETKS